MIRIHKSQCWVYLAHSIFGVGGRLESTRRRVNILQQQKIIAQHKNAKPKETRKILQFIVWKGKSCFRALTSECNLSALHIIIGAAAWAIECNNFQSFFFFVKEEKYSISNTINQQRCERCKMWSSFDSLLSSLCFYVMSRVILDFWIFSISTKTTWVHACKE